MVPGVGPATGLGTVDFGAPAGGALGAALGLGAGTAAFGSPVTGVFGGAAGSVGGAGEAVTGACP